MRKDKWNKLFDIIEAIFLLIFIVCFVGGMIFGVSLFTIKTVQWLLGL